MLSSKIGMVTLDITGRFTYDLEVANHCVLSFFIPQKFFFVYVPDIAVDSHNCLKDMGKKVLDTEFVGFAHIGLASATTLSRKCSGNAFGVKTATGMPSSLRSSNLIAPISINVVFGVGSTN